MMRSDWDNMYKASTDVINKGLYNLKTPYNEIFTDDGENSGGSIFELQCTATAALPQSDVIGSQFCEVQGVRGAGQWDLGWGWHMATQLMADAYETGDPRKNATLLYFRKTDDEPITPENTNEPYGESPSLRLWELTSTKKLIPTPHCVRNTPTKDIGSTSA